MAATQTTLVRRSLTTPRAAAVASIAFSAPASLRWMAYLVFLLVLFLLFSLGFFYRAPLVSPLWVLLISVHILGANLRTNHPSHKE